MMNDGFVKLNRKVANWEWYKDNNTKALFFHCLIKANFQDAKFQGHDVPKGSFVTSLNHLAEETGMSRQNIKTALAHLEKTQELTRKVTNKFTLIKVNKWELYQCCGDDTNTQANTQLTLNQHSTNTQLTPIEERKEYKKDKKERNKYIYAPSYESSNAIIQLPTNQTNDFYYIHSEDLEKYKGFYPALDIEQELRNMSAWLDANPKNRKTHNGMPRFINNWLSISQNKARAYDKPKEKKGLDFFYE